jgi:hypothetical protein
MALRTLSSHCVRTSGAPALPRRPSPALNRDPRSVRIGDTKAQHVRGAAGKVLMSLSFPDRPTAAPDNPLLYDAALLNQAIQCAAAADAYSAVTRGEEWFVHYLLIGTGIECALKAFAILHQTPDKKLRAWGHNLARALEFAEAHDLPLALTDMQRSAIQLLNESHVSKVTTFPLVKGYAIPRPQIVRGVLDELIRAVFVSIWGQDRYEYDRNRTPGMTIAPEVNAPGSRG